MKMPAWGDSDLRQRVQFAMRELAQKCAVSQAIAAQLPVSPERIRAQAQSDAYLDAMQQFAEALTPRAAKRQPTEAT